jgi:hypothetical protein
MVDFLRFQRMAAGNGRVEHLDRDLVARIHHQQGTAVTTA